MQWFREGLRDSGYVEGKNLAFEFRHADTRDRLRAAAGELIRSRVDVVVTAGDLGALAAQQSTPTIPIVALAGDLVGLGLASSVARPGKNLTGVTIFGPELNAKRLALLKELVPDLSRVALLWSAADRSQLEAAEEAARTLSIKLQILEVKTRTELPAVFEAVKRERAEAINVLPSPLLFSFHPVILEHAARERLPTVFHWKEAAEAGGLVSYGPSLASMWRQMGGVVAKVLKGANPATLPIEQATQFELVINLKTAKALGLNVPQRMLVRADKLID